LDPVTHTLAGATLSATGLRRTTPCATATLILAANAPDVDIVTQALGPYSALALRRGITHGLPAMVVLPFVVTGLVVLWDRRVRQQRGTSPPPVRPAALLGLSFLGVATHPVLDWVNTYGMRWLMPFDGRWTYGDAIFIVDPWMWLVLGGALFALHSAGKWSMLGWSLPAAAMSLLVLATDVAPPAARFLWVVGLASVAVARVRLGPTPSRSSSERIARLATAVAGLYLLAMILQTPVAERLVVLESERLELERPIDVMVGPVPANPFAGDVILRTPDGYWRGAFHWFSEPRVQLDPNFLVSHPPDPVTAAAAGHPAVRDYLTWSRFPLFEVVRTETGWFVTVSDVRYRDRAGSGGLGGLTVEVGDDLQAGELQVVD
jgi:inner membrane protein